MAINKTFAVIIPTYRRPDLLSRLLDSLVQAIHPENMQEVIVVENGDSHDAERLVASYVDKIEIKYLYITDGGVSKARNAGIQASNADCYIFFDNDVRIGRNTLVAYDEAFQQGKGEHFWGGQLLIDYDEVPQDWLLQYLPCSAKGFDLGQNKEVFNPVFLGGNFALSADQIKEVGLFDESCTVGVNNGLMGEETRIQELLLHKGHKGLYLQDAIVWHYVPKDRCSKEWTLKRGYRHGLTEANQMSLENYGGTFVFGVPRWIVGKFLISLVQYMLISPFMKEQASFKYKYEYSYSKGMLRYCLDNKCIYI